MADRETVMYDIERCTCHVPDACRDCSHYKHGEYLDCMEELLKDTLAVLKEQQQQIWELQDMTEHLKDKLKGKKKPIEDFGMFVYKKHFRGELSAENLAFINMWISKYMEQT